MSIINQTILSWAFKWCVILQIFLQTSNMKPNTNQLHTNIGNTCGDIVGISAGDEGFSCKRDQVCDRIVKEGIVLYLALVSVVSGWVEDQQSRLKIPNFSQLFTNQKTVCLIDNGMNNIDEVKWLLFCFGMSLLGFMHPFTICNRIASQKPQHNRFLECLPLSQKLQTAWQSYWCLWVQCSKCLKFNVHRSWDKGAWVFSGWNLQFCWTLSFIWCPSQWNYYYQRSDLYLFQDLLSLCMHFF